MNLLYHLKQLNKLDEANKNTGNLSGALDTLADAAGINLPPALQAMTKDMDDAAKAAHFAKNWRSRRVLISLIQRCNAGMPQSMKRKTTVKWSACMRIWSSQF